ncbi:MAG: DUF3040 domain-containing protein [Streptosporangiaceae bacterium]
MSLSAHEQQALDGIASGLAHSDPRLASLLATFSKLTSGEEMPAREKVRVVRWNALRRARRMYERAGFKRVALVLWLVIGIALVAVALAVSHGGSGKACVRTLSTACPGVVSVHSSSLAHNTTAG